MSYSSDNPFFDVCIVGGGPAGAVLALRLSSLGHCVCLVERVQFPRRHVGESLTPGIRPILSTIGLEEKLLAPERIIEPEVMRICWSCDTAHESAGRHLLIDRSEFDLELLQAAAANGVRIYQPARISKLEREDGGWRAELEMDGKKLTVGASYLVDASGRSGLLRQPRQHMSPRTIALCGYLRLGHVHPVPIVEALCDGWCWGAPVPSGLFSVMVFMDWSRLSGNGRDKIGRLWRSFLCNSKLLGPFAEAPAAHAPTARDATAYFAEDPISENFLRVGEANFTIDPLSSTGVERSIQDGLVAAVVLHTILNRPERRDLCEQFYRSQVQATIVRHAAWTASMYDGVKRFDNCSFWISRSCAGPSKPNKLIERGGPTFVGLEELVHVPPNVRFSQSPCLVGDEIESRKVLVHPNLDGPIAFVEGVDVGALVGSLPLERAFPLQALFVSWSLQMPLSQARRIVLWLLNNGVLKPTCD